MIGKAGMLAANRLKGWSLASGAFLKSKNVISTTGGLSMDFSPDGTKLFVADNDGDSIEQFSLSVAYDVATISSVASKSIATGGTMIPFGLAFKPDGTRFLLVENYNAEVREYDLSTPFDITTATFSQSFSVVGDVSTPGGLYVSPDGDHMYIVHLTNDELHQYSLSSWSLTSASHVRSYSLGAFGDTPRGITFKPDGTLMYICQDNANYIAQYAVPTAWDISSITGGLGSLGVSFQTSNPEDVTFSPDGVSMFVMGALSGSTYIFQYATP